jgi:hypothetical protein
MWNDKKVFCSAMTWIRCALQATPAILRTSTFLTAVLNNWKTEESLCSENTILVAYIEQCNVAHDFFCGKL